MRDKLGELGSLEQGSLRIRRDAGVYSFDVWVSKPSGKSTRMGQSKDHNAGV